jgi:hypothetical protein
MKPIQIVLTVCAALLACGPLVPVAFAQDQTFCPLLKRAIEAKPKGFANLKVKPFHGSTKEWDARVKLPGTQFCRVDQNRKIFNCWLTGLSGSWTAEQAGALKNNLTACLGQPASPEKTDDMTASQRTTLAWESDGARIELVTRIGKTKPEKHSVFVYVR